LYCLSLDLRLLITPLLSSNSRANTMILSNTIKKG
jgi:hypothetical protein